MTAIHSARRDPAAPCAALFRRFFEIPSDATRRLILRFAADFGKLRMTRKNGEKVRLANATRFAAQDDTAMERPAKTVIDMLAEGICKLFNFQREQDNMVAGNLFAKVPCGFFVDRLAVR